jgi:hypothetical protein
MKFPHGNPPPRPKPPEVDVILEGSTKAIKPHEKEDWVCFYISIVTFGLACCFLGFVLAFWFFALTRYEG